MFEDTKFSDNELNDYISATSPDLFMRYPRESLKRFEEAKRFSSLILLKRDNAENTRATLEIGNLLIHVRKYCPYYDRLIT